MLRCVGNLRCFLLYRFLPYSIWFSFDWFLVLYKPIQRFSLSFYILSLNWALWLRWSVLHCCCSIWWRLASARRSSRVCICLLAVLNCISEVENRVSASMLSNSCCSIASCSRFSYYALQSLRRCCKYSPQSSAARRRTLFSLMSARQRAS